MIRYHIYMTEDSIPFDLTAPVADVATPYVDVGPVPAPGVLRVLVRAYDDATGLEESNVDCTVRIEVDAAGHDISRRPMSPLAVVATTQGTNSILVKWKYFYVPGMIDPAEFRVYATSGLAVDYAATSEVVPYMAGIEDYSVIVPGLIGGTTYSVSVRAALEYADDGNSAAVRVTPRGNPPLNPTGLTATATFME
jgi:hypothetical protein